MCRLISLVECVGMCSSEITEANVLNTLLYSANDKVRGGREGEEEERERRKRGRGGREGEERERRKRGRGGREGEERVYISSNFYFFRC